MFVSVLFAIVAATSTPTASPPSTTAAPPPVTAASTAKTVKVTPAADPIVCEEVESTGSHMSERQCMHKSEWAAQSDEGQDDWRSAQRSMSQSTTMPH